MQEVGEIFCGGNPEQKTRAPAAVPHTGITAGGRDTPELLIFRKTVYRTPFLYRVVFPSSLPLKIRQSSVSSRI